MSWAIKLLVRLRAARADNPSNMAPTSSSNGKTISGNGSAKRSLGPELEDFEMAMRGFMAQMQDSMQKLHAKVDNVVT